MIQDASKAVVPVTLTYEQMCKDNGIDLPPEVDVIDVDISIDVAALEQPIDEQTLGQYATFAQALFAGDDAPENTPPDIFDVLSVALAARCVDTIVGRIKNRSMIVEIIDRLAHTVQLITTIAERLNVDVDGVPVVSTKDFSNYSNRSLIAIGNQMVSRISSIIATGDMHSAHYQLAANQHNIDVEKIKGMVATAAALLSVTDARAAELRESVLHANSILESYHDQDVYVVANVAPDGSPRKFLRVEPATESSGTTIVGVDDFKLATKWGSFRPANNRRVEIVRERRAKVAKPHREAVSKSYVVMRTSLRVVTLSDIDEE